MSDIGLSPIQKLEEKIKSMQNGWEKIDLLNSLAWQFRIRDPEHALKICMEALALSRSVPGKSSEVYDKGTAVALVTLGFLYGEAGNLDEALSRSLEALSYIKGEDSPDVLVGAWYTLGWSYYYSGDYPAALEFGLKSLELARKTGLSEWEAWCLDLTASTYKEPAEAIQLYVDAFAFFEQAGNIEGQSRILNNWAYTLMETGAYQPALEMARRSYRLARSGGLKRDQINVAATIGEIHSAMGHQEQAQQELQDAYERFDEYGRDISSVFVMVDIGHVYLKQDELEKAEEALNEALRVAIQMEMRNEQSRCYEDLSNIYERQGKFDKALDSYKMFFKLREAIMGEGTLKQVAALRVSHQIENFERDAKINRLQKEKLQMELDEHKRINSILQELATRDSLTGLFNRRHFLTLAGREWDRSHIHKTPLCALMLDIDHFKQINDQYGHAVGDKALVAFATVLRSELRASEIYGRYGGDEFVILLPEADLKIGRAVAERIRRAIREYTISAGQAVIELVSSIGIAVSLAGADGPPNSLSELLNLADHDLYRVKRDGKNGVTPNLP